MAAHMAFARIHDTRGSDYFLAQLLFMWDEGKGLIEATAVCDPNHGTIVTMDPFYGILVHT